nr:ATP-binding protein [Streptomyces sp. SID5473]
MRPGACTGHTQRQCTVQSVLANFPDPVHSWRSDSAHAADRPLCTRRGDAPVLDHNRGPAPGGPSDPFASAREGTAPRHPAPARPVRSPLGPGVPPPIGLPVTIAADLPPRQQPDDSTVRTCLFDLPADHRSVSIARRLTETYLDSRVHCDDVRHSVTLLISELATNAVRHASGIQFRCRVRLEEGAVRIEVEDRGGSHSLIRSRRPSPEEECGRGLQLVECLSKDWGMRRRDHGPGSVVWAVVAAH